MALKRLKVSTSRGVLRNVKTMTGFWVDEDFRRYLIAEPIGVWDSKSLSFTHAYVSLQVFLMNFDRFQGISTVFFHGFK